MNLLLRGVDTVCKALSVWHRTRHSEKDACGGEGAHHKKDVRGIERAAVGKRARRKRAGAGRSRRKEHTDAGIGSRGT